jgi:hypothetical protein
MTDPGALVRPTDRTGGRSQGGRRFSFLVLVSATGAGFLPSGMPLHM